MRKASAPTGFVTSPEMADYNQTVKADAIRQATKIGLTTLGIGGMAGLLASIPTLLSNRRESARTPNLVDVELPYPQVVDIQKKSDYADSIVKHVIPTPAGPKPHIGSLPWLRGDTNTDADSIPWSRPLNAIAGVGGTAVGFMGAKALMRAKRRRELDHELAEAQRDYENAMLGMYDPDKLHSLSASKEASEGDAIDQHYAAYASMEKTADLNDLLGRIAGTYLSVAAPVAAATGYGSYKYFKDRSDEELLRKAIRRRAQERATRSPSPVFVRPVPVVAEIDDRGQE